MRPEWVSIDNLSILILGQRFGTILTVSRTASMKDSDYGARENH